MMLGAIILSKIKNSEDPQKLLPQNSARQVLEDLQLCQWEIVHSVQHSSAIYL